MSYFNKGEFAKKKNAKSLTSTMSDSKIYPRKSMNSLLPSKPSVQDPCATTAVGSRPQTPREAHDLPVDPEQEILEHELVKASKSSSKGRTKTSTSTRMVTWTWTPPLDEPVHICTELGEDDPDPFMPDEGQLLEDEADFLHIPPHLPSIYA
ncbi:hypothetical protein M405DRAFT_877428 [Rhizopogon salebrosus TDB-379]|nr:hypothetical protein M405DRAFT_877428 [Rhizopogon salebrosus TDB-379]